MALSDTKIAEPLREDAEGIYRAIVPVFFVVMGMLVVSTVLTQVGNLLSDTLYAAIAPRIRFQ